MEEQKNNPEVQKEMTNQAIDRALQQVQKNWFALEKEELIPQDEWNKAKIIIVKAISKHIKNKYGI